MEIRSDNISSGVIEINKILAVNKDGTVVDFVGSMKVDLAKNIKEDGHHKIYMATSNQFSIKDRYTVVEANKYTESEESDEENNPLVLKIKPSFLFKHQITGQNTYIPILNIYASNGSFSLVEYTPPTSFISKHEHSIFQKIVEVVQSLNIKFKRIEERFFYLFHHNIFSLEIMEVVKNYLALSQSLSKVNILLAKPRCYVEDLFDALSNLYYSVHVCLKMPTRYELYFDKEDINASFYKILHFIRDHASNLLVDDFIFEGLNVNEKGYFQFVYNKNILIANEVIFGVYSTNIKEEWIMQAIIGGKNGFVDILSQRVVGIRRTVKHYLSNIKAKSSENLLFFVLDAADLSEGETYYIDMGRVTADCKIGYYKWYETNT